MDLDSIVLVKLVFLSGVIKTAGSESPWIAMIVAAVPTETKDARDNILPAQFPERHRADLFPQPWPHRDLGPGKFKLPMRDSPAMQCMAKFFYESNLHAKGDMKKFASYFGVKDSSAVSQYRTPAAGRGPPVRPVSGRVPVSGF